MNDRTGLSRGDRNRNARLARLRVLVPFENAIVGIDLADAKQAVAVTGHDSRVIARRAGDGTGREQGERATLSAHHSGLATHSGLSPGGKKRG